MSEDEISEVIAFPSKAPPEMMWVCGCGCASFTLGGEGDLTCTACSSLIVGAEGGWYVPKLPDTAWEGDNPITHVMGNDSVDFARERMGRHAREPDVSTIIVVRQSGQIHTWTDVDNAEGVQWLQERLTDAEELITRGVADE